MFDVGEVGIDPVARTGGAEDAASSPIRPTASESAVVASSPRIVGATLINIMASTLSAATVQLPSGAGASAFDSMSDRDWSTPSSCVCAKGGMCFVVYRLPKKCGKYDSTKAMATA